MAWLHKPLITVTQRNLFNSHRDKWNKFIRLRSRESCKHTFWLLSLFLALFWVAWRMCSSRCHFSNAFFFLYISELMFVLSWIVIITTRSPCHIQQKRLQALSHSVVFYWMCSKRHVLHIYLYFIHNSIFFRLAFEQFLFSYFAPESGVRIEPFPF